MHGFYYDFFNYMLFVFDTIAHYIAPKKAKKVKTEKLKKVMACNPCGYVYNNCYNIAATAEADWPEN